MNLRSLQSSQFAIGSRLVASIFASPMFYRYAKSYVLMLIDIISLEAITTEVKIATPNTI